MISKVIFESEEEAREILKDITNITFDDEFIWGVKHKGYIRKSAVEEAEDMYYEWSESNALDKTLMCETLHKQHEVIQYLKTKLEEKV